MSVKPDKRDSELTDSMSAAIRDADDQRVWNGFGHDIQQKVIQRRRDGPNTVVMSLHAVPRMYEYDGRLIVEPAVSWAVEDVEGTVATLKDHGHGLIVVWEGDTPVVDDIRETVADALEDYPETAR